MGKFKRRTILVTDEQYNQLVEANQLYNWYYYVNNNIPDNDLKAILNTKADDFLLRDETFYMCYKYLLEQVSSYYYDDIYEALQGSRDFQINVLEDKFGAIDSGNHLKNLFQWAVDKLDISELPMQVLYELIIDKHKKTNTFKCDKYSVEELEMALHNYMNKYD